jgi:hypothetical protein
MQFLGGKGGYFEKLSKGSKLGFDFGGVGGGV